MQTRASLASFALVLALCSCVSIVMPNPDEGSADDFGETTDTSAGETSAGDSTDGGPNQGCCECVDGVESCELSPLGDCEPGEELLEGCEVVDGALACGLECAADPGYCCTCDGVCVLAESPADCVEADEEWHDFDSCEFVPPAFGACDGVCEPRPGYCCTCPDADSEAECWPWEGSVEACEVALAGTLNETTHWCEPDAGGKASECLSACSLPEPGYCCTCEDGCWLSPSEVECVGFGEWHTMDSCTITPASEIDCGLACPLPDFVGCCYCNELGAEVCVTGTAEQCNWQVIEYPECTDADGTLGCGLMC